MGNNATANGGSKGVPPVVLDTTLRDLLLADRPENENDLESMCFLKPNSDKSLGTAVPLSNKYIIHSAQIDNANDLAHLQLENCSHLLMFFLGAVDVLFLACEGETDDDTLTRDAVDANARRSFSVIQESQRPRITTYANIDDFIKNHNGSKIRWGFAMDFAERLPYLFHPELIYELNSKRWLAVCDLKSANDTVLDCEVRCPDHRHNCEDGKTRWYYGGSDCHQCTAGCAAEIERIRNKLTKRQVPYVLKLTQSLSAVGTLMVEKEKDRQEVIDEITQYLDDYLPRVTKENAHLETTSLILSDFVPGETMALNFFVDRDGSPVFLGACHQLATGESGRQATAITYADQEKLKKKYQKSLEKIGKVLHDKGYYGAVGADIMEDKDGNLFTIDLNVRTPLSLVLYLLKGHFNDKRGLKEALVYECVQLRISRDALEEKFRKEFEEARIILLGAARMGKKEKWAYGMVLAGEDRKAIEELSDRILKFEAS